MVYSGHMGDSSFRAHGQQFRAERSVDRFQPAGLVVEVAQIIAHEGDEPDALADLRHSSIDPLIKDMDLTPTGYRVESTALVRTHVSGR